VIREKQKKPEINRPRRALNALRLKSWKVKSIRFTLVGGNYTDIRKKE
jgi:hypothetical protein